MFLVILCATIAVAVLVYMLTVSRPSSGAQQRRHPRLDVTFPVHIHTEDDRHVGESRNISQGGMLLQAQAPVSIAQPVRLKFSLDEQVPVEIPAVVSYKKGVQIGVRFDPAHNHRAEIDKWIQQCRAEAKAAATNPPATAASNSSKS
jgi:hypothetical protein